MNVKKQRDLTNLSMDQFVSHARHMSIDIHTSDMSFVCIQYALDHAKTQLKKVSDVSSLESYVLLAHVLQTTQVALYAWPERLIEKKQWHEFLAILRRRLLGEPLAYILGTKEFWSLSFLISPDVLIPRPETELLVECALKKASAIPVNFIADLGCGSGAIALALATERPTWRCFATDCSEAALAIAQKNAYQLQRNNVTFCQGHWCDALPFMLFNMIISNPPYLSLSEWEASYAALGCEPELAFVAGEEGYDALQEIILTARFYLVEGGCLLLEHGANQAEHVRELLRVAGYQQIGSAFDLAHKARVTWGYIYYT